MEPVDPVIDGAPTHKYGEGQPEYNILPAITAQDQNGNTVVVSRWRFTDEERAHVAAGGDIYLTMFTCGMPLQPVILTTELPVRRESVAPCVRAPHAKGVQ